MDRAYQFGALVILFMATTTRSMENLGQVVDMEFLKIIVLAMQESMDKKFDSSATRNENQYIITRINM